MTEELIHKLIEQMTLDEKISMIHGNGLFQTGEVERLHIPPLKMSDGPMGVRADFLNDQWIPVGTDADAVSYCPSNSAIACTWNRDLARKSGKVLGKEARGRGKDMILAPGINVKRTPACGRNFEYFSEDPYLISELAVPLIEGIEESDVSACVKHFALNQQEEERLWVNVEVDERTLREIYLPGFEAAVKKAGVSSLMGAYNLFRGEHCCESEKLLGTILRKEWGYDGVIVSDWGAVHHTTAAALSPLDIEMSVTPDFDEYCLADPLKEKIESGEIPVNVVDEKVRHILKLMVKLKMIVLTEINKGDETVSREDKAVCVQDSDRREQDSEKAEVHVRVSSHEERKRGCYNTPEHRSAILDVARESIVLLKNEEHRLPFTPSHAKKVLVIGQNAVIKHALGGGSAEIKALYEITPLLGISMFLGGNATVDYLPGYEIPKKEESDHNWQEDSLKAKDEAELVESSLSENGAEEASNAEEVCNAEETYIARNTNYINSFNEEKQQKLQREALAKVKDYDEVIFVGGLTHEQDTEGKDRATLELPYGQSELIRELLAVRPDMVVVMMAGSPVAMGTWSKKAKAIVYMSYSGMEGGTALAEVLFGKVNPSGKLAESFPYRLEDMGIHTTEQYPGRPLHENEIMHANLTQTYSEGVFVGYRYYEKHEVPVQFCFGHGLSYTEFSYKNISLETISKAGTSIPDNNREGNLAVEDLASQEKYVVRVTVKNTGICVGKEIVQLYVGETDVSVENPVKELRGFEKVSLQPGEEKEVTFILEKSAFAHYDTAAGAFVTKPGNYTIYIGSSCEDIRQKAKLDIA